MEKEEVLNNIRYNERLINDLSRRLNQLNNQQNSLNREIDKIWKKVDQCDRSINDQKKKMDDVEVMKRKLQQVREEYEKKQRARINALKTLECREIKQNFMKSYLRYMNNLIKGPEATRTIRGLDEATEKTKKELNHIKSEIAEIRDKKIRFLNDIDELKRNVSQAKESIDDTLRQLSYRRDRLSYWKRILRTLP